ncbi:AAA family ATPase [Streptomyces hokutonensis]|uniref:AAA family ATPase n=1 Tax=Streptomyces hokutonensis TaxID=1306990 RepID=UPI00368CAF5C
MTGTDSTEGLFGDPHDTLPVRLPAGPPWRRFGSRRKRPAYVIQRGDTAVVNAALQLRRPLLVTGFPGVGKSSLAYAIADDLGLGEVLHWAVNSRSVLTEALYRYDAVARLRDAAAPENAGHRLPVEKYVVLGPLGTALASPAGRPRVLLIDELDKGDIDLPNDLLTVFEEGAFEIPELSREAAGSGGREIKVALTRPVPYRAPSPRGAPETVGADTVSASVVDGWVYCHDFPVVVITSNGERDFPPAFLRRCVRLDLGDPDTEHLKQVVEAQFGEEITAADEDTLAVVAEMINEFSAAGRNGRLATDQLLNAIHLRLNAVHLDPYVLNAVLRPLDNTDPVP